MPHVGTPSSPGSFSLDATYAGGSANSYVANETEANAIATQLGLITSLGLDLTGWNAATGATKAFVLKQATNAIDRSAYTGRRWSMEQRLEWPRIGTGVPAHDYQSDEDDQDYPDELKYAQVAEAISRLSSASTNEEMRRAGVKSFSVGETAVSFGGVGEGNSNLAISPIAESILHDAGLIRGRVASVFVPRG